MLLAKSHQAIKALHKSRYWQAFAIISLEEVGCFLLPFEESIIKRWRHKQQGREISELLFHLMISIW